MIVLLIRYKFLFYFGLSNQSFFELFSWVILILDDENESFTKFKLLEQNIISSDWFSEYCKIKNLTSMFGGHPTTLKVYKVRINLINNFMILKMDLKKLLIKFWIALIQIWQTFYLLVYWFHLQYLYKFNSVKRFELKDIVFESLKIFYI